MNLVTASKWSDPLHHEDDQQAGPLPNNVEINVAEANKWMRRTSCHALASGGKRPSAADHGESHHAAKQQPMVAPPPLSTSSTSTVGIRSKQTMHLTMTSSPVRAYTMLGLESIGCYMGLRVAKNKVYMCVVLLLKCSFDVPKTSSRLKPYL
uniref:Uncharacterized protein n=1 Tax=Oryza rufipogon TaxID=4529 RepID=A0A0E0PKB8_ORYRU